MQDYRDHDALALAALVREGAATPDELLAVARARAAEVEPHLNALVREVAPPSPTGPEPEGGRPFAGVPFLLKDLHQDLAGVPTSGGSRSMRDVPAAETATVVERWVEAGLVVFGKTSSPEFGAKGITEPHAFGATRNPWDLDRTPGGSSGGSAAAVAAGVVPMAAASDGGGSIRIPASACGLFGLKPSRGLVPYGPAGGEPLGGTATDGVVSRSVRDTAAALEVLAGPTGTSVYLPGGLPAAGLVERLAHEPDRLRVGVTWHSAITPDPHPEAKAAVERAAALLSDLGHEVVEVPVPFDDARLARDFLTTWFVHCAVSLEQAREASGAGEDAFEPDTRVMAALGRATSATDYVRAVESRHEHVRRLADFHADHDLLLTPTTATPPPRIGAFDLPAPVRLLQKAVLTARAGSALRFTPLVEQMISENLGWVPYTQLANLTGRPAMSVPLHWTPDGLPMGVQLVGRLGADEVMLRLAAQLERAAPWWDRTPPL
ncbi:amidase family protein [Nocardioides perillae]|uniref:Asp-tRNA(Asn)/Glu-tRNA(Gln) amidotransferase A subunit family amidase n=1 Tax=Nocardioides perillae TaxID=1119534 RepID=A0A7Y9RTK8_9ACTN|nr:Asp-tRNA(Asn)/Glu-tRNA(Gln) amidotransferase A subunit family amidase [Nocardioides perillae]